MNFAYDLENMGGESDVYERRDAIAKEIKESLATGHYGVCYRYDVDELFVELGFAIRELTLLEQIDEEDRSKQDKANIYNVKTTRNAIQQLIVIAAKHEETV